MILTIAQLNPIIADIEGNTAQVQEVIKRHQDSDMFVFPECVISGYNPLDYLYYNTFFKRQDRALLKIQKTLRETQSCVLGLPRLPQQDGELSRNDKGTHKDESDGAHKDESDGAHTTAQPMYPYLHHTMGAFNSAVFLDSRGIVGVQHKRLLPRDDIFFETRYFQSATKTRLFSYREFRFAVLICEDLWGPIMPGNPGYDLLLLQPDFIVVINASPYELGKKDKRRFVAKNLVQKAKCPLFFCNMLGANDEIIFDGSSFALHATAKLAVELAHGKPDSVSLRVLRSQKTVSGKRTSIDVLNKDEATSKTAEKTSKRRERAVLLTQGKVKEETEEVVESLELGLRDYLKKSGLSMDVHLGISGGIDSAVVAAIACRSLGSEHVRGILLPSRYTSKQSWKDACELMDNLKMKKEVISIDEQYEQTLQTLQPILAGSKADSTEENLQSRIRGLFLMAYANKRSSSLLTTGNKSELAVGYATLYGDMCGALNIIGDIYKTEIYAVAQFLNNEQEIIPKSILFKEPSAELRENQKDKDSLPPYELLDEILYQFVEEQKSLEYLVSQGDYDEQILQQVWNLYVRSEFKRYQAPPILKISARSFGRGRFVPLVAKL